MTIKFTFSADAQRMLDAADERWISEHGYSEERWWLSALLVG